MKTRLLLILLIVLIPSAAFSKAPSIAVLPWKVNAAGDLAYIKEAMSDMLSTRLGAAQMEVLRPEAVKGALASIKAAEITDTTAAEAGKRLNSDYVLYGSVTVLGDAVSLDAKLLRVKDSSITPFSSKGTGLDSIVGLTDKLSSDVLSASSTEAPKAAVTALTPGLIPGPAPTPSPPAAPLPSPTEPKEEGFIVKAKEGAERPVVWRSASLEGVYLAFASADLDRDGDNEMFLLKTTGVTIAKIKDSALTAVKEVPVGGGGGGVKNIAISSIDSDADGVPEVYISGIRDNSPYSSVLEFRDNDYKITIKGVPWLMRTVVDEKGATALIGQGFRYKDAFYGPLKTLKKEGGRVVETGTFIEALPKGIDIYRMEVFNFNPEGSPGENLVALDGRNYARVYKKRVKAWEEVWRSAEFYGGSLNLVEFTVDDRPVAVDAEPVVISGRFFHEDLNGDGRQELIIKRNIPGGLGRIAATARSFVGGTVLSLSFDGGYMTENWRTKEVPGYVADFFIDEPGKGGARDLYMLVVEGAGAFTGGAKSYILSSRLPL